MADIYYLKEHLRVFIDYNKYTRSIDRYREQGVLPDTCYCAGRSPMIYLGSPYSPQGDESYNMMEIRHRAVMHCVNMLISRNIRVFSPIVYGHAIKCASGVYGGWEFWKQFDIDMLNRCDEMWVYEMPCWQKSTGLNAEISHANDIGKPVYYLECLPE